MRRSTGSTGPWGCERLRVWHLNDSCRECGSRVDRHAGIGAGHMGLEPFRHLVNDPRFRDLPMILETPKGIEDGEDLDARNLRVLRQLVRPAAFVPKAAADPAESHVSSNLPRAVLLPAPGRIEPGGRSETAAERMVMSTTQLNGQAVTAAAAATADGPRSSTQAGSSIAS